jgi:hypothetical protein
MIGAIAGDNIGSVYEFDRIKMKDPMRRTCRIPRIYYCRSACRC